MSSQLSRRLTIRGKRVYIKHLTSLYALVSYSEEGFNRVFSVSIDELARLK